jgi:Phosphotransferase enzyme family
VLLVERPVAASIEELLRGATERRTMSTADSKSGARFERVWIDGEPHVIKHLHVDDDWIMRSTGDLGCRPVQVWQSGILDQVPDSIDHAVVGAAAGLGRNGWGAALLMRDVSASLVPEGDGPVPLDQHLTFLDHMAALHATFWEWTDTVGLAPPHHRYLEFSPDGVSLEEQRGWPDPVPPLIVEGWQRLDAIGGPVAGPVIDLARDPSPLVGALSTAPQTLVHGDWKLGNLGRRPDGRTVLLDWAVPGQGSPAADLAWYLAINAARLPQTKEATIAAYRASLESHGVATAGWWDRALALSLLGGVVLFGWEKALGGPGAELAWWLDRGAEGLGRL